MQVAAVVGEEQSKYSDATYFTTSGKKLPFVNDLACSFASAPKYESVKVSWGLNQSDYKITVGPSCVA